MSAATITDGSTTITYLTFDGPIQFKQPTLVVSTRYGDDAPIIQKMNDAAVESVISGVVVVSGGSGGYIAAVDDAIKLVGKECTLGITAKDDSSEITTVWVLGESHNWKTTASGTRLNVTFRVLFKERTLP